METMLAEESTATEPSTTPCGTTESPCVTELGTETTSLLLAGFGLLVVLSSALLVTAWGRD
jgi:hypothetical protein